MASKEMYQRGAKKNPVPASDPVSAKTHKAGTTSHLDKKSMLNKVAKNKGDKF